MQPLYDSIMAKLSGDEGLRTLLGTDAEDPRIYQTYVQFHSEASIRGKHWVTFNKREDVSDGSEQTNAIREIRFEVHSWGRDADSDLVDQIDHRIRVVLDRANLNTDKLLAWFCLQTGSSTRVYEVDQKVWHGLSVYECRVADKAELGC